MKNQERIEEKKERKTEKVNEKERKRRNGVIIFCP
jgi:hypothetical protein